MVFKLDAVYDRHRPVISMMQDGAVVTIWTHDGHQLPLGGFAQAISNVERRCAHRREYLKRINGD
jgi:hypothetical protein